MNTSNNYSYFIEYLKTPILNSPDVDFNERVFQNLKMLSSNTGNKVYFRKYSDTHYIVYTDYKLFNNTNVFFKDMPLTTFLPNRSIEFMIVSTLNVVDNSPEYDIKINTCTVKHIINTDNESFIKMMEETKINAFVSYEGSVFTAYYNDDLQKWFFRTTSRLRNYDSEDEEYSMLTQFKIACPINLLDELRKQYDNHYFVFVLTNYNKYLCNYDGIFDGPTVILINVRNSKTQEDVEFKQNVFSKSVDVSTVKTMLSKEENNYFANEYLNLQGFILTDKQGTMYRTFTRAYHAGTIKVPNNPNFLHGALQSYLKGTLNVYLKFKKNDKYAELKQDCSTIANGLKDVLYMLFTYFTKMELDNPKKRYTKLNNDKYGLLFADEHVYKKVLSSLQSFSINNVKGLFNNNRRIEQDIYAYIRFLGESDVDFMMIVDMLNNYETFIKQIYQTCGNIFNNRYEHAILDIKSRY
jgi:hypothetical protein